MAEMLKHQGSDDLDLEGSFLKNLPPSIKRYTYHGDQQFLNIIQSEFTHFEASTDASELILFHASRNTIENIFDPLNEDSSIAKFCTAYDTNEQLFLAVMASRTHSAASGVVDTTIRQTLAPMGMMMSLQVYAGALIQGQDRGKIPDYGWGPRRRLPGQPNKPSVTLEVAHSETDPHSNRSVRFWLDPNGANANICLTLQIMRSRPGGIRIEKWERQNSRNHRSQSIWITRNGNRINVTDHPLVIPFESLFRCPPSHPGERDLKISQEQLQAIARTIWEAED